MCGACVASMCTGYVIIYDSASYDIVLCIVTIVQSSSSAPVSIQTSHITTVLLHPPKTRRTFLLCSGQVCSRDREGGRGRGSERARGSERGERKREGGERGGGRRERTCCAPVYCVCVNRFTCRKSDNQPIFDTRGSSYCKSINGIILL